VLDAYSRKARLAPAVLAAVPGLGLLGGGVIQPTAASSTFAIVAGAAAVVVCGIVRDRGRRLQASLWQAWGGSPTVQRLRWRGDQSREDTARLHERLAAALRSPVPTEAEETADPERADRLYEEAIDEMRERTRNRQEFKLVFEENVEYGFRRNALGLKPFAVVIAGACLVISLVLAVASGRAGYLVPAAVAGGWGVGWWKLVTEQWVCEAAERYADQLLRATHVLPTRD
jgi:hypothetical protein